MSLTKTSKIPPTKMLPNSRKFYHWPAAIGVRESTSIEDLSSQILTAVGEILDEHSKVVRDELFSLREAARGLKDDVGFLKQENIELNKRSKLLQDENRNLREEVFELKIAVKIGKEYSEEDRKKFEIPGTSGICRKHLGVTKIEEASNEEKTAENSCPKKKFITRSAKTDWFWTAAKEKINSSGSKEYTPEDTHGCGKTSRPRKVGKEKRMPFAWVNSCRIVGENITDKSQYMSRWEDLKANENNDP